MKLTKFIFEIGETPEGNIVVRNMKNLSTIELSQEIYRSIREGDYSLLSKEEYEALIEMEFLTSYENEFSQFRKEFDIERIQPEKLSLYLATTMSCNLNCVYCFEDGVKNNRKMNIDVFDKTLKFIDNILQDKDYEGVYVNLFGGEPMMNYQIIEYGLPKLNTLVSNHNLNLTLSITTNATLLTKEKVDFMVKNGLSEAQITLDGTESVHDLKRKYKNGKGSFNIILKNSLYLHKQFLKYHKGGRGLCFRINIEPNTYTDIKKLIDVLHSYGFQGARIYFSPIVEIIESVSDICASNYCKQAQFANKENLSVIIGNLSRYAHEMGFRTQQVYRSGPCMDVSEDDCLIDPSGDVYKCLEMIGRKNQVVGNVYDGYVNKENLLFREYYSLSHTDDCYKEECNLLPICNGGCRVDSLIRTGKLKERVCEKTLLENLNKELLKTAFNCIKNIDKEN